MLQTIIVAKDPLQVSSFMDRAGNDERFAKQHAGGIDILNTKLVEDNHYLDCLYQKQAITKKVPADFVVTALIGVVYHPTLVIVLSYLVRKKNKQKAELHTADRTIDRP